MGKHSRIASEVPWWSSRYSSKTLTRIQLRIRYGGLRSWQIGHSITPPGQHIYVESYLDIWPRRFGCSSILHHKCKRMVNSSTTRIRGSSHSLVGSSKWSERSILSLRSAIEPREDRETSKCTSSRLVLSGTSTKVPATAMDLLELSDPKQSRSGAFHRRQQTSGPASRILAKATWSKAISGSC